ncbi:hypothetical protein DPX39_030043700 [Trypanosoma brucei equiperdum]|nr:hypothetical protein DPX39_030043700 [Trypanosoma brucei equiperdum]
MDYTDIYLRPRKKESASPQEPLRSAQVDSAAESRVEWMLKGAFSVQQLLDRVEELSARVCMFDEKMVNLTKLVKLAQGIQEEKEADIRFQQQELLSRLKRLEQACARLEDMETFKQFIISKVQETLEDAHQAFLSDLAKIRADGEEQAARTKQRIENTVSDVRRDVEERIASLWGEAEQKDLSRQEAQDTLREKLRLVESSLRDLEMSVGRDYSRVPPLQEKIDGITQSLSSLEQKVDKTAGTVVTLGNEAKQARALLMEEIETTRQWVTRNLQRVKQHVEVISSDVEQLHNGRADLSARISRISCQADMECKKLRSQLSQKALVADALDNLVQKEFYKVEDVALRHQSLRTEVGAVKDV